MAGTEAAVQRRFSASDIRQLVLLVALLPVAMFLPERHWKYPCRLFAAATARRIFPHSRRLESYLPEAIPRSAGLSRGDYLSSQEARFLEEYVQVLREWTWRWRPAIQLQGRTHLEDALAAGRGAILWVSGFESSDLVVKIALREAGFPLVHLSRPTHGYSNTRFGVRFLNPVKKRIEDRYLRSRIVIAGDSAVGALRALQRALHENAVVSITVSDASQSVASVPLLGGALRVSAGPAQMAARTGAPLIPVFTMRDASGAFFVRLGPPIAGDGLSNDLDAALKRYSEQLEGALRNAAGQWTGWRTGSFNVSPPASL